MITPGLEIQLHPSRQYEIIKDHEYRENLRKVTSHYRKPRSPGDIFTPKKNNDNNNHQLILHPIRQMEIMREKNMAIQLHPSLKNIEIENEKEEPPREPIRIMSNKERRFRQFVINDKFQTI